MAEIKGIDVSAHNGSIDWKTVANYGIGFAILRITEKGNKTDSTFENNLTGCRSYGIPVGVYKYSYALNEKEAIKEAEKVISVLSGRGLDLPVFYDLEYNKQEELGSEAVENIAVAFLNKIKKAGYAVGIYCNADWYENTLTDTLKRYDCWIARYPKNDDGNMQERLKPSYGVGWQYSSKATIPGIKTKVDRSIFWKDYTKGNETMTVRMSNCGHDENNRYKNGKAGDQTGTEWYLRNWYSYPWNYVIRWKDEELGELCAELATEAAKNELIGYDQNQRDTFWTHLKASKYRPKYITVACEADCSSGTIAIIRAIGYLKGIKELQECNATYTGDMMSYFRSAKGKKYFTVLSAKKYLTDSSYAKRGDINLNTSHHVNITVDNGSKSGSTTNTGSGTSSSGTKLNKTQKFVGAVTAYQLNVRSYAGFEYANIKSYPVLSRGNLVSVCDTVTASDGSKWYYVKIADKYYGFVYADYVKKQ